MSWSRFQKISTFGAGGLLGSILYWKNRETETLCSWTTNTVANPCGIWDRNWDHRDPASLVKPLKENSSPEEENEYNSKLEKHKPTATRHIIMIRHGQYNTKGEADIDRILTETGRVQAKITGERLKELKIPFDQIFFSTMTRAQETGKIILKTLPELKNLNVENDTMLEEGAPIPPQPPIGHWRPEPAVISQALES
jgi:serine/threonine-protein phosphatase PGAM5